MKLLDFEPATHKLNEILFPVALIPITSNAFNTKDGYNPGINISDYFAVIDQRDSRCLSVVSKDYRLVTNQEAINLGKHAFKELFPSINVDDLVPYKVIASSRKTICHIDLVHKDINFKVFEQDTWYPFLRISNSYNKTLALSFELGFVRKLCSNGVIFNKKTVSIKYLHTQSQNPWKVAVDVEKLKALENAFKEHLLNLKRFYLPKKYAFPLLCKALNLNYSKLSEELKAQREKWGKVNPLSEAKLREFIAVKRESEKLINIYVNDMGENALAAFNMISDIISNQEENKIFNNYANDVRALNYNLSNWVELFASTAELRNFNIETYLKDQIKYIELLNTEFLS